MDFAQVLLVRVFHVLHIALLHLLRHDDCGGYTKSPCRFSCGFCILGNLEPLFKVCHCTTSKCFQPLNVLYLWRDSIQWMSLWWSSLFYFRLCCLFKTEHSCVVEVVLLGMSRGLGTIYGSVASQFGDITNVMKSENIVQEFIRSYLGIW